MQDHDRPLYPIAQARTILTGPKARRPAEGQPIIQLAYAAACALLGIAEAIDASAQSLERLDATLTTMSQALYDIHSRL